jgi:hypothetical protein
LLPNWKNMINIATTNTIQNSAPSRLNDLSSQKI